METIKLENLTIGYKDKVVQSNLNAVFESGQLVCLLGRNGIGKSTLLRTLAMFQPALGGEVRLEEKALNSYSVSKSQTKTEKRKASYNISFIEDPKNWKYFLD